MGKPWTVSIDGEDSGPFTSDELREMAVDGRLSRGDLVWREGMQEWAEAGKVKGLFPERKPRNLEPPKRDYALQLAIGGLGFLFGVAVGHTVYYLSWKTMYEKELSGPPNRLGIVIRSFKSELWKAEHWVHLIVGSLICGVIVWGLAIFFNLSRPWKRS